MRTERYLLQLLTLRFTFLCLLTVYILSPNLTLSRSVFLCVSLSLSLPTWLLYISPPLDDIKILISHKPLTFSLSLYSVSVNLLWLSKHVICVTRQFRYPTLSTHFSDFSQFRRNMWHDCYEYYRTIQTFVCNCTVFNTSTVRRFPSNHHRIRSYTDHHGIHTRCHTFVSDHHRIHTCCHTFVSDHQKFFLVVTFPSARHRIQVKILILTYVLSLVVQQYLTVLLCYDFTQFYKKSKNIFYLLYFSLLYILQ